MLKQNDEIFNIEKRKGIELIVVRMPASISGDVSGMEAKINEFGKSYRFYFPVDGQIFFAEAIRRPSMKKGLKAIPLNP
jgi:hypothetical protein